MRIYFYWVALPALLLCCCSNRKNYSAREYLKEVEHVSNGLHQEVKIEEKGMRLEMQLRPPGYSALKELGAEDFSESNWVKLNGEFENTLWFEFRIAALNNDYDVLKNNLLPEDYTKRITYLTGEAQKDFRLKINEKDTLMCAFFHFERTFNMTPFNTFLLGFDALVMESGEFQLKNNIELIYNDQLFGLEPVKFNVNKEQIEKFTNVNISKL